MPNPQPKTRLFDKSWGCRYIRDLYTKVDFKYLHVYVWNASPGCIIEEAFHFFFFYPHPPPFLQSNNIVCHAETECVMHRAPVFLRGMSYRSWDGVKQGAPHKGGGGDGGRVVENEIQHPVWWKLGESWAACVVLLLQEKEMKYC